jgi:hypothetical protein
MDHMINIMFYLHDITEKLLKVVLNTIIPTLTRIILALRPKKTRAIRRALNSYELSMKTAKQQRKERLYPARKFAVKE